MKKINANIILAVTVLVVCIIAGVKIFNLESRVDYLESIATENRLTTRKKPVTTSKPAATPKPTTTVPPVTERYIVDSGSCGINAKWTLFSDGELVVSGEGAMDGCTAEADMPVAWDNYRSKILKATIGNGITYIGYGAFANCDNLESVSIPDTVTVIGSFAFSRCGKLKTVDIPENTTVIEAYAFSHCTSFESVIIPESVTEIGLSAFYCCANLKTVTLGTNITEIPDEAFNACVITDVYYTGTEEQWNAITIGESNARLIDANIKYNA